MDERLLEKFFNGQCSEAEKRQVLDWYLSGQADEVISGRIEARWKEEQASKPVWEKSALLHKINQQIDAAMQPQAPQPFWQRIGRWKYAATVVLLLLPVSWWFLQKGNTQMQAEETASIIIRRQTEKGERKAFRLEDGTLVKLNADSRIWYRQPLGEYNRREVFLEGEAFFEVVKDAKRPFQVHTGKVATTVLGTSFNINAYSPEDSITVSVVSGKVKVQQNQQASAAVYLLPEEQAVYAAKSANLSKNSFEQQRVLAWKDGTIYFRNASFEEIVLTLERWYGVDITVSRRHIEDGFSGAYTNRSLESVLNGISFVLNFEYEIKEKKVFIK